MGIVMCGDILVSVINIVVVIVIVLIEVIAYYCQC